jgi:D-arabinose 1-dehydrogenase-like Zn-dependent alcohol dehydrogenase
MPVRPAPSKPHKSPPPVSAVVPARVPAEAPVVHAAKPHGSAIGQVVQEVREIVGSLEQALEEMEEVLRLVELAEQQKSADERELEALRRALHKLRPPQRERREDEH